MSATRNVVIGAVASSHPGRHRIVLRALSADRRRVLDASEAVTYTIPRTFAQAPTRCGV